MSYQQTDTKIYDDCKCIVNSSKKKRWENSVEPSSLRECSIISEIIHIFIFYFMSLIIQNHWMQMLKKYQLQMIIATGYTI